MVPRVSSWRELRNLDAFTLCSHGVDSKDRGILGVTPYDFYTSTKISVNLLPLASCSWLAAHPGAL